MYIKPYHIHFVGIGGIGMSGIALLLSKQGYIVSGCDAQITQKSITLLQGTGCTIFSGNNSVECTDPTINLVVYSSAIAPDNGELLRAQQRGTPTMHRAQMLAELMRPYWNIAVSGAHGKTTTTGLIAHMLLHTQHDPSIIIGGFLNSIGANARLGAGDFFVAEADESDRSLLHLPVTVAVVTNIDREHLETYADLDDIIDTFKQFIDHVPSYGAAIVCLDDENILAILSTIKRRVVTYGFSPDADIHATEIQLNAQTSHCTVMRNIQELGTLSLQVPGHHTLQNALAAVAVGLEIGIPFATIAHALATFSGVERRFSYHGTYQGAEVFDDYGHHPNEIKPTVAMARKCAKNKLIVVFQPHRYSRTEALWADFVHTLAQLPVDQLIITDIYSAGEPIRTHISSERMIQEIQIQKPQFSSTYVPYDTAHDALQKALSLKANSGDLILLMGAGSIYTVAKTLCTYSEDISTEAGSSSSLGFTAFPKSNV